jgi:hypothetical protein
MGRKEGYIGPVRDLLEHFLSTGDDDAIRDYLTSNSNLPGPRGNLELANAFADVTADLSERHSKELWSLLTRFTATSPDDAPANNPRELIPFCGAIAIGAIASVRSELGEKTYALLKNLAADPRWRTREGVAMGLQRLIEKQGTNVLTELDKWISGQDWLAMRAVAAGVAEPALLKDERMAYGALDLHKRIIDRMLVTDDRKADEFRILRQALGYSLSVVVSSCSNDGFEYMRHLAKIQDPDILWILRENLKKKRLVKYFPRDVDIIKAGLE